MAFNELVLIQPVSFAHPAFYLVAFNGFPEVLFRNGDQHLRRNGFTGLFFQVIDFERIFEKCLSFPEKAADLLLVPQSFFFFECLPQTVSFSAKLMKTVGQRKTDPPV